MPYDIVPHQQNAQKVIARLQLEMFGTMITNRDIHSAVPLCPGTTRCSGLLSTTGPTASEQSRSEPSIHRGYPADCRAPTRRRRCSSLLQTRNNKGRRQGSGPLRLLVADEGPSMATSSSSSRRRRRMSKPSLVEKQTLMSKYAAAPHSQRSCGGRLGSAGT